MDLFSTNIVDLLVMESGEILDKATMTFAAIGYSVIRLQDFMFATPKGVRLPAVLAAHTDVVGEILPVYEDICRFGDVISLSDQAKRQPQSRVLGGDDRAGVYVIIKLIKYQLKNRLPLPFVVLTDKEESGCLGAQALVDTGMLKQFADEINIYLGFDRRGGGEVVTYSGSLPNWVATWIAKYGFVLGKGYSSDVAYFTRDTGTVNLNFSVGFHNEHTLHETLHMDEVEFTLKCVAKMLQDLPEKRQMQKQDL